MARSRTGYHTPIEYIGPRPQKPKKPNFFGGWVIVVIAFAAVFFFAKPLITETLASGNSPSKSQTEMLANELVLTGNAGDKLAAEALLYSNSSVQYDPAYFQITYPNGDVPANRGVAADLVVRCYREIGIDLQERIHEDMERCYRLYPQLWGSVTTDSNIDHRRVPNLQRFFSRHGEVLAASRNAGDYQTGDIVVWTLPNAEAHIGIIVPGPEGRDGAPWVVHHPPGSSVKWEDALFDYQILGHFRYLDR